MSSCSNCNVFITLNAIILILAISHTQSPSFLNLLLVRNDMRGISIEAFCFALIHARLDCILLRQRRYRGLPVCADFVLTTLVNSLKSLQVPSGAKASINCFLNFIDLAENY